MFGTFLTGNRIEAEIIFVDLKMGIGRLKRTSNNYPPSMPWKWSVVANANITKAITMYLVALRVPFGG